MVPYASIEQLQLVPPCVIGLCHDIENDGLYG